MLCVVIQITMIYYIEYLQLLELKWSTTDKANTSIVLNRTVTFSFTQNITVSIFLETAIIKKH